MADVVQRWRVVYARGPAARNLAQRAELEAWEAALLASGLPIATGTGPHPRPRLGTTIPLPVGLMAAREPIDLHFIERRTAAEVRECLEAVMPPDHRLVELFDVWTGAPPLAAQVVAADYAISVATETDRSHLEAAISGLLAADRLERVRRRGDRESTVDLRPFLLDLAMDPAKGRSMVVRMRLAAHPETGTGRPDEVLEALADAIGSPIEVLSGVRERLWTADEVRAGGSWESTHVGSRPGAPPLDRPAAVHGPDAAD